MSSQLTWDVHNVIVITIMWSQITGLSWSIMWKDFLNEKCVHVKMMGVWVQCSEKYIQPFGTWEVLASSFYKNNTGTSDKITENQIFIIFDKLECLHLPPYIHRHWSHTRPESKHCHQWPGRFISRQMNLHLWLPFGYWYTLIHSVGSEDQIMSNPACLDQAVQLTRWTGSNK